MPSMPEKRFVGIDPSFSGLGFACVIGARFSMCNVYKTEKSILDLSDKSETVFSNVMRCSVLSDTVKTELEKLEPDVVCVEAPIFHVGRRATRSLIQMGMLQYAIQSGILNCAVKKDFDVILASPTARAKYMTGNGQSDKPSVVRAFQEATGMSIGDDNAVDALILAMMAASYARQDARIKGINLCVVSRFQPSTDNFRSVFVGDSTRNLDGRPKGFVKVKEFINAV